MIPKRLSGIGGAVFSDGSLGQQNEEFFACIFEIDGPRTNPPDEYVEEDRGNDCHDDPGGSGHEGFSHTHRDDLAST